MIPPVHQALREALANCLVNADYYGRRGVLIIKRPDIIILSNPGNLRIELSTALSGGVSYPRNSTMLKMFNFIDIGERAGSGIPNIFRVWKEQKWSASALIEEFDPDRLIVSLPLKIGDKKPAIKTGDKKSGDKVRKTQECDNRIPYRSSRGNCCRARRCPWIKSVPCKAASWCIIKGRHY